MKADFMPGITSVYSDGLLLASTLTLLQHVEALPHGATGVLAFGDQGVILVEKKRVCWAVAFEMKQRLTDILCEQSEPPLLRAAVEELYRSCKREGTSMGEALMTSGFASEASLRAALLRHTCEAIIRLAQGNALTPTGFTRHEKEGYAPRFVFTTTELLASLSGRRRVLPAEQARTHLASTLVPDVSGFAFLREVGGRQPVIIAVAEGTELGVVTAMDIARWSTGAFDVASFVDPTAHVICASCSERLTLLAWRRAEIHYAAVCRTRAGSALLLSHLVQRSATSADMPRGSGPSGAAA
jgi:hypothetical protein